MPNSYSARPKQEETYRREYSKVNFFKGITIPSRREQGQQLSPRDTSITCKWNLQIIIVRDIRI